VSVPSSELAPPNPSSASECVSPLDPKGGEQHSLSGEGVGGPNSNERIEKPGTLCIQSVGINNVRDSVSVRFKILMPDGTF
jgi:hypothetical protein